MELLHQHSGLWLLGLVLALLVTGVIAGILAGLLGGGGGIVIVPVLYHLFTMLGIDEEVRMHVTVGTSLATIIPTSIMSSRAHLQGGSLDLALIKRLMPSVIVGVLAGSVAARYLSGSVLAAVFATVALVVALNMAFKREGFALSKGLPGAVGTSLLGGGIGGISTLMDIGGGTLSVPILNALRVPMHTAVGTGAMLGMVISFPGALAFLINGLDVPGRPPLSLGYVNLLGMAMIVPATIATTGRGARIAHTINARRLRQLFAVFLVLTSLRLFYGLLH
jgi:uncharacterized membrane protein YfcA